VPGHASAARTSPGVIICPAKRTAVIGRTPSPVSMIRFARRMSTAHYAHVAVRKTKLVRDSLRFRPLLHGLLRRNNAAIEPERKKAVAARGAAIRWHAEKTKDPGQHAHAVLAGNALQIHVAAQAAMHKPDVADGGRPGVKAGIAGLAAPGTQPRDSHRVVFDTASAGAAGAVAMTDRTYQNSLHPWEVCEKNTEELLPWQVRSAHRCRCMYNGPEALAPRWNRDGQEPLVAARHRQPLAARR
jgi:hypothetical protein